MLDMIDSRLVQYDVRPATGPLDLAAPKTFSVDLNGVDSLFLQVDFTKVSATALVFSFTNNKAANPASANKYVKYRTDMSGLTAAPATITVAVSATGFLEIPFPITGLGVNSGIVNVTVTATGGAAGDTVNITPVAVRVS